jgi:predicted transcriptional regulator
MDLQAEKLKLVQAVLNIDDVDMIKKVKKIFKKSDHDWFVDLTEEQQQSVTRSLEQLDRGEGIPHEEAMARLGL